MYCVITVQGLIRRGPEECVFTVQGLIRSDDRKCFSRLIEGPWRPTEGTEEIVNPFHPKKKGKIK